MSTPEAKAEAFRNLDFHDDTLVAIRVLPPQRREAREMSAVEMELRRPSQNTRRIVRFSGCRNLRIAMDFDVLAANLPPNTSHADAHTHTDRMRELMRSHQKDWGVEYKGTSVSPLAGKLTELSGLACFRAPFLGGALEVIAQDFTVRTS